MVVIVVIFRPNRLAVKHFAGDAEVIRDRWTWRHRASSTAQEIPAQE
jgi:hypothetical protein